MTNKCNFSWMTFFLWLFFLLPFSTTAEELGDKDRLTAQLAAHYALESWKNAWQAGDVETYLAAYSQTFSPADNLDLHSWKRMRIAHLTRPKYIRVTIKNPVVEMISDSHLRITFTQMYESNTYQDTVNKTLLMVRETGGWKIREELAVQEQER